MSKEDKDKSLEDLLKEEGYEEDSYDYEDEYVYGDSDELDESFYGEMDLEDYDEYDDEYDDPYANPREDRQVRGRYSHLIEEDEEISEDGEEPKLTLQQKVAKYTNKTLDFVESKRFNTMQWVVALGALIIVGVVIYLLMQAGTNLGSNVEYQEKERVDFVARKIAPEEYEISKMKNVLGKCADGKITINPELMQFKKEIIEYVVAHEFCHLKYKTHGKRFFEIIEKYIPEYQKYEREIQNYEF